MFLLLLSLSLVLMFVTVFIPAHRAQESRARREFEEQFRLVKLATVRDYYPEMRNLSNRQIALRYDYEDAYWKIR